MQNFETFLYLQNVRATKKNFPTLDVFPLLVMIRVLSLEEFELFLFNSFCGSSTNNNGCLNP